MKKIIIILILFSQPFVQQTNAQGMSIGFNTFHQQLSPYGNWINYPPYGEVWHYTGNGFRPYYNDGYWAYTNMGWAWVSDYNWGWAPFHYGRWINTLDYGWLWVPGYEWAPAWVSWCRSSDYYGWAPLGPGWGIGSFNTIPNNYWVFVPHQYINHPAVHNYYINNTRNVSIIKNATVINNIRAANSTSFQAGPAVAEVTAVTKSPVQTLVINTSAKPGKPTINKQSLTIYKPVIKTTELPSGKNAEIVPDRQVQTQVVKQNHQVPAEIQPVQKQKEAQQIKAQMQLEKQEQQKVQQQKEQQQSEQNATPQKLKAEQQQPPAQTPVEKVQQQRKDQQTPTEEGQNRVQSPGVDRPVPQRQTPAPEQVRPKIDLRQPVQRKP